MMAKTGRPSVSVMVGDALHKKCPGCEKLKPHADYSPCAGRAHGIRAHCKICSSAKAAAWNKSNADRHLESLTRWRAENPERQAVTSSAWHARNRARKSASALAWYHSNKPRSRALKARRRASMRGETRPFDADLYLLVEAEAFDLAAMRESVTGGAWHVDHVVPVVSPRRATLGGTISPRNFCGPTFPLVQALHNEFNFAVIDGRTNLSKGNRSWPGMP